MSESKITEQDVRYVAELANLDLREDERTAMVRDLNSILGYIERLNELNTDNVQPMAQVSDRYGVDESKEGSARFAYASREDVREGLRSSLPHGEALKNAPDADGTFFRVPKVIEKFAERYALFAGRLLSVDYVSRAVMLEKATEVIAEMVGQLRKGMVLDTMKELNDRMQAIEGEADRLILDLYHELYNSETNAPTLLLRKDLFELLEKAIDRCRDAGNVIYAIALKNS